MERIEKYHALIFDMDGTLFDIMRAHLHAWCSTAEHFNFPFAQEWLHSLGGMPSYKIAAELIGVKPAGCVVFEDTKLGMQAAHAAGMDCFLVEANKLVFYPLEK